MTRAVPTERPTTGGSVSSSHTLPGRNSMAFQASAEPKKKRRRPTVANPREGTAR
jgi:hypothetical protein